MQRGDSGILRESQDERVLAPAGADHEDTEVSGLSGLSRFAGHERRSYVPWIVALAVAAGVVGGLVGGFTDLHV
jgi:hypothetical protein